MGERLHLTTPDYTRKSGFLEATGVVENEKTPGNPEVFHFLLLLQSGAIGHSATSPIIRKSLLFFVLRHLPYSPPLVSIACMQPGM
jgi:hypothetical protein